MKTNGPKLRLEASCFDCEHCQSNGYKEQGDSGHMVYCAHPDKTGNGCIGDTTWDTPKWCPLLPAALAKFIEDKKGIQP